MDNKHTPQYTDLSQLPHPTEDNITAILEGRFSQGQIFTRIASSVLLQLNPHFPGPVDLAESTIQDHVAFYKDPTQISPSTAEAHILELATSAYLHMRRTGQDQSIITSGQSGSGKTEAAKQLTRQLLALSAGHHKKETRILQQILASNTILEAFGNAKTLHNDNASRFGRFTELQFNERGRLLGAKMLDYFLEKRRVTMVSTAPLSVMAEERNFHIFYQLLQGATTEEKTHLHLNDSPFHYLSSRASTRALQGAEDAVEFTNLKTALKVLGFQKRQVAQIFQVLAAILHLGNLVFMEDTTTNTNDACVVRNIDTLILVSDILGVDPNALQNTLTYKTKMIKKELCSVFLDTQGANAQRDELAQGLYSLLFSWVVEFLNVKLCNENPANFIGIVDLFGFQQYTTNRLDQFCVNYANERLHHFFLHQIFETTAMDLEVDGVTPVPRIQYFDNAACLELLGSQANEGLIGIMSAQSKNVGRKTDSTMLEAFSKQFPKHDSLTITKNTLNTFPTFTVRHYQAPVSYSVDGWLEQNTDILSSDFVTLFRGGLGVAPCGNPFVQSLFTDKTLTTESHPRHDNTIVAAQQSIKPKRAPSMRRPKKDASVAGGLESSKKAKVVSVAAQIQSAMSELCDTLEETTPWFLVCLKSNEGRNPNHFDTMCVKSQVRALGLAQVAQRLAVEYTINCTHTEFLDRYKTLLATLLPGLLDSETDAMDENSTKPKIEAAFQTFQWTAKDASLGRCRVFLSEQAWRGLEYQLKQLDAKDKKSKKETAAAAAAGGLMASTSEMVSDNGFERSNQQRPANIDLTMPMPPGPLPLGTPISFGGNDAGHASEDDSTHSNTAMAPLLMPQPQHPAAAHGGSGQMDPLLLQQSQQQSMFGLQQQPQQQQGYFPPLYHPVQAPFMAGDHYDARSFYSGDDNRSEYDPYMREPEGFTPFENESVYGGSEIYRPGTRIFGEAEKRGMLQFGATEGAMGAGNGGDGDDGDPTKAGGDGKGGKDDDDDADDEKPPTTAARRNWVILTWALTWWIPSVFLSKCGKMVRPDIRMAWREKVALCTLILFLSLIMIFYMAILGELICPHQYVFSYGELSDYGADSQTWYTTIRGEVFDLGAFIPSHNPTIVQRTQFKQYAGAEATAIFPVQPSALCDGLGGYGSASINPLVQLPDSGVKDPNSDYHDFRAFRNDSRPDWYYEKMVFMRQFRVGFMAYTPTEIRDKANLGNGGSKRWAIIDGNLYDMTAYIQQGSKGVIIAKTGETAPSGIEASFMEESVVSLFKNSPGQDVSEQFRALPLDDSKKTAMSICLRNLFFVGRVDERSSAKCQFANYMLLIPSILIVCTIAFKFLAALQLGSKREPEEHDKFVILQVPCYTEGEESLRKTLDSLATLRYDDKRKLLFVIADGMIIGSGNDRPTPRIVLDILGVDPNVDPEPLSFLSLGDGLKQHNMGKIYSGLYEHSGHVVPYIVVVKVGTPVERQRPGNRGKRDSQMILMRFLNKVHFNSPMTPLELEMYHQIKNVIGVNPSFYEYVLMVDSDTEVLPDSLNRMVSVFLHDTKVMGLCGETQIENERDSWVTMMQVYEYFISHHLAKAFESLFGSVTCLPGCFCMYRIRTPTKSVPLLISNNIIEDYSENRVDTLHKKNLLHLGEDRYLTTLMLKHFPNFKMTFTPDAQCRTNVPDQWSVLLSQRRRWINSTVHNLMELIFLPQLCGFCCFSMRFIVMIDLFATLIMPVTVIYIGYLLYTVIVKHQTIPTLALILMAAVYGLQAIIFILRRKWEHIGWMIVYILAIPVFSFYLPIYSFWHFDDFSWGNTRVVVGDKGRKIAVAADESQKFDPKTIPQRKWSDYEQELWEVQTAGSMESKATAAAAAVARYAAGGGAGGALGMPRPGGGGSVYGGGNGSRTGSVYGGDGLYAHSRPQSPAMGLHAPIPMTSMHLQQQVAASPLHHPHQLHQLQHMSPSPSLGFQTLPLGMGSPQMLHAIPTGVAASPGMVASTAVFPAGASPMINTIGSFPPGSVVPVTSAAMMGTPQMAPMTMRPYTPPTMVGQAAVGNNPRASWTGSVAVPGGAGAPVSAAGGGLAPAGGATAGSRLSYQAQQQPQNRF
ncbi:hypothetical protein DFQ26_006217 [Actinomortierella ambigua]|nr:hypothetical protein DFQ26_006217 [Actinomortierella ambigua]